MTIYYGNSTDFYEGIAELVKRGCTFRAERSALRIILLGGY